MDYPNRKHPRLNYYDYSTAGAYFVTICIHNRNRLLAEIVKPDDLPPQSQLTGFGKIAMEQLLLLEERYPHVRIGCYVIMPDHIHVLLHLQSRGLDETPRANLNRIIGAYKSLTTRKIQAEYRYFEKLFQASFFEHIIRNRQDYNEIRRYISENPMRWFYKNK